MTTDVDARTLGFCGLCNHKEYTYDGLSFATSLVIKRERVWERLSVAVLRNDPRPEGCQRSMGRPQWLATYRAA